MLRETGLVRHFTIHPATAQFVARRFGADPALRLAAHRRVGTYYEAQAKTSAYIDDDIEAGHHLFQAGEYDRSYELLGAASSGCKIVAAFARGCTSWSPSWPSPSGRR